MPLSASTARGRAGVIAGSLVAAFAASTLVATPAQAETETPEAASASLTWGVKASFRDYVVGPIAQGAIDVAGGAVIDGDAYSFPAANPALEEAAYTGSVHFTGHHGELDLTIADPGVAIDGETGSLTATVTDSDGITAEVAVATLDLADITPVAADGLLTFTDVPATLTEEGAPAFLNYTAGTVLDPVTFSVPVIEPTVTVSATELLDGTGETITVTGSGFLPDGTATNGTHYPTNGIFGGAYVAVGKYPETWKPSEGVPTVDRHNAVQAWALPAETIASTPALANGSTVLSEDGSFSVTFTIDDSMLAEVTGNWGVYTYGGGSSKYADFETYTPITFAPRVEVSQVEGLGDEATVTVVGHNFLPAGAATTGTRPPLAGKFTGAYVAAGKFADEWSYVGGAAGSARTASDVVWAVDAEDADALSAYGRTTVIDANGRFETTLTFDKWDLVDTDGSWGVYTYPAGGAKHAPFETATPVSFASDETGVVDVAGTSTPFKDHINWLFNSGITTGWEVSEGAYEFRPFTNVNRDMMAAFLYRLEGADDYYEAPEEQYFTDVPATHPFFKEISWLAETGITTGWPNKDGSVRFQPATAVNRDMMAAFLYRFAAMYEFPGTDGYEGPATSPFLDVKTSHVFYDEISWLASVGVTTGWNVSGGAQFRPATAVKRDVMAAFLYRFAFMEWPI